MAIHYPLLSDLGYIHRTGRAFRSTSLPTTANCCVPHPVLSRVLDVTFTSFVCIHTSFTVSSFGFGLARESATGMHLWPFSLSLEATLVFSRTMYLAPSPSSSTAHAFRTRYTIYRTYAKGGRTVPRTRSVFVFFGLGSPLCLTLHQRAARRSLQIYTDEKTEDITIIRARWRNERILPAKLTGGRSYTTCGRKPGRAELLLRGASGRGRKLGMTT